MKNKVDKVSKLVPLLTKAICYLYIEDATKPSLVISFLPHDEFYVSVVRYSKPFAQGDRTVVLKQRNHSLERALSDIAEQIVKRKRPNNPIEQLTNYISEEQDDIKRQAEVLKNFDDNAEQADDFDAEYHAYK